jgi:rRNA processing protein Gar1
MAFNLVSPGVKVREVDLTIGRIDPANNQVAGFAGPFQKGPINDPVLINTEQDLLRVFGKPLEEDAQNEYWHSASSYLSYGGVLRIVRADDAELRCANVGVASTSVSLKINSLDDFNNNHSNDTSWLYSAKTPGTWANKLKVCTIDNAADQRITGLGTTGVSTTAVTPIATKTGNLAAGAVVGVSTNIITGITTSLLQLGYYVTGTLIPSDNATIVSIGSSQITLNASITTQQAETIGATFDVEERVTTFTSRDIQVGYAVTQQLTAQIPNINGTVTTFNGYVRGIITNIGEEYIDVKITDRVNTDTDAVEAVQYKTPGSAPNPNSLFSGTSLNIVNSSGVEKVALPAYTSIVDWYNQQTLGLDNSTIYWSTIASKPGTSEFASERNSSNDELHVVVVDDSGDITGTAGQILEKFTFLSKGTDARTTPSEATYYKTYLANKSEYIYAGYQPSDLVESKLQGTLNTYALSGSSWGVPVQSNSFKVAGARTYELTGGYNYVDNGMQPFLSDIISSYETFRNPAEYALDFLLCGPSGGTSIFESQAKAAALISLAESRKDCIAVISPHKESVINIVSSDTQTENIVEFFDGLASSSYAVFDSGYKYTYDRFNSKFIYLPCNPDIAGLMARTSSNNYPWFSPAGSARGTLNNAIKLAYNPSQSQRDALYTKRINPVIALPGSGIILFGDKTALGYSSAFDRINVRRLFLTIEKAIEKASRTQLFEFNDEITRNNFVNIVEPYLRDIKGKRGITDFIVVCDETNNTPDVIDSNYFVADIFVKPARSINFINLTFVATRTGVSFSEVIGTV